MNFSCAIYEQICCHQTCSFKPEMHLDALSFSISASLLTPLPPIQIPGHCYVIIIDCLLPSFDNLYFSTDGCVNKSLTYLLTPLHTTHPGHKILRMPLIMFIVQLTASTFQVFITEHYKY